MNIKRDNVCARNRMKKKAIEKEKDQRREGLRLERQLRVESSSTQPRRSYRKDIWERQGPRVEHWQRRTFQEFREL